jgi:MFS family permease
MRFHALDVSKAGFVSMAVYGLAGIPGLIIGGYLGDAVMRKKKNGRMLVGSVAMFISAPFIYFGLTMPKGSIVAFMIFTIIGIAALYVYYSTVYSAIQDVVEPSLRGTAMAIYFFAMYVVGGSFGPVVTGSLSDSFTRKAAMAAGVTDFTQQALEPFRGAGLHSAMFVVPAFCVALIIVLYGASRTITKDMERLEKWMAESAKLPVTAAAKQ